MAIKLMGPLKNGRAVKNLTDGSINPLTSQWTDFDPNTDITFSGDDLSATFTYVTGVSNRAFLSRAITVVDTQQYPIRFLVSDKSGSFTRENVDIVGDLAASIEIDDIADGLRAVEITANAAGTITYRIGFGIDGNETVGANAAFTITNVQIEELSSGQTVPSEFINVDQPNRATAGFARDVNSTVGTPASGGLLTESYGDTFDFVNNFGIGFITDSFGDEDDEFVKLYEDANTDKFVNAISVAGGKLEDVTNTDIDTVTIQGLDFGVNAIQSGILVIQRCVNDFVEGAGRTAVAVKADLDARVTYAKSIGLGVVVFNCAPFGNNASWTAGKETEALAYNAAIIVTYGSDPDVELYDVLTDLATPATFDLAAANDSGDGLHPNATGQAIIETGVETEIDAVRAEVVSTILAGTSPGALIIGGPIIGR